MGVTPLDESTLPRLAGRVSTLSASAIGSVLRLGDATDLISLAAGSPAVESFCAPEVAEVTGRLLAERPDALQYGDTAGLTELRQWVADHVGALLGRRLGVDETVLAHGSQQALDLICKAVLDPGDVVVVDRPSYVGALQVFGLYQARVVGVPLAEDDALAALHRLLAAGTRPKLLYVVPNFANPSGATLSAARRAELVELAERYRILLVEDDPYGELGFGEPPPAPIASLSPGVVRMGSFSKVLFPAARLGYLTGPRTLVAVLNTLKQAADLGNSRLIQLVVHALVVRPGFLAAQIERSRALYRGRRDALATSLRAEFGTDLTFTVPAGGFFIWADLARGVDAAVLLPAALRAGVSYVPGSAFYSSRPVATTLRLSFSGVPAEAMARAADRLRTAWDDVVGNRS
jgi:2-aminoadipate transaminase